MGNWVCMCIDICSGAWLADEDVGVRRTFRDLRLDGLAYRKRGNYMGIIPLEYPVEMSAEATNIWMRMLEPYGDVE